MGQKCPCYKNKSTEENTFFYENHSYRNQKYEDLILSKNNNYIKTNNNDNLLETNYSHDPAFDKVIRIQRFLRMSNFKIRIKPSLFENTIKIYDENRAKFTSNNLQKAENQKSNFQININPEITKKSFVMYTKILFSNDKNSFYSGQVNIKTQKHGKGFLINHNCSKYEGIWNEDEFIYGKYIDSEGNLFEGHFINGMLNGQGILLQLSACTYTGNFVNNEKSGVGIEETSEYIYEGDFLNNKKHGNGKQTFKHLGDIYTGEFLKNFINGSGMYIFKNGEKYNGFFEEGMMSGIGTYTWPDGSEYIGEYLNNLKHGDGIFKMSNGKIFEGQFAKGRPHGKGKLTNSKGISDNVEFVDGKIVKKDKSKKLMSKI